MQSKQPDLACEALATYYRNATTGAWWRRPLPPASNRTASVFGAVVLPCPEFPPFDSGGRSDAALQDVFYLSGVDQTEHVPRLPSGFLNW